jgi:hypothetical protein
MLYNLAFGPREFSNSSTVFQANSPKGNILAPYLFASALEACPRAFRAAMPCEMILVRHKQNASANGKSGLGSHPASSLCHCNIVSRGGKPPFSDGGVNCASASI